MKIKEIKSIRYVSDEGFEFTFKPIDDSLTITKTETGYEARYLVQDDSPQSPGEWGDDALFLVADHREFCVKPPKGDIKNAIETYSETHYVFGLETYIHSGVVLALSKEGNFPDRMWDVSQLGAVFVSKTEFKTKLKARQSALSLINTWNEYLSGDVYGIVKEAYTHEKIQINNDAVWGFYGYKDALESLKTDI